MLKTSTYVALVTLVSTLCFANDPIEDFKISSIYIQKSSTLPSHQRYVSAYDKLKSTSLSFPFERLPYRAIFIAQSFYECNDKGDIWVNHASTKKQLLRFLVENAEPCREKKNGRSHLKDSIAHLQQILRQKYGTRVLKSPLVSSETAFLATLTKLLVAFDEKKPEYGQIGRILVSDHFAKTEGDLWVSQKATTDQLGQFLAKRDITSLK